MNPSKISPDDPRLTAYALGEMDPAERAEFERRLEGDPVARAVVQEIAATATSLGAALREEPAPAPAIDAAAILAARDAPGTEAGEPLGRARILRFPQLYFVVSGLAAACFAVFFVLHESRDEARRALQANQAMVLTGGRQKDAGAISADEGENRPAAAAKAAAAPAALRLEDAGFVAADRFVPTAEAAASAFPLRVGRDSYEAVRALLRRGLRPARESVRVAEMINAFAYTWPAPAPGETFSSVLEETEAPWAPGHRLVRIGLKGRDDPRQVLADDARVEVEFNPARVLAWRIIGFERDGAVAGVRGAEGESLFSGDAVTVLYELVPVAGVARDADPNLLRLALRYREPVSGERRALERVLPAGGTRFADASADMKFATAVAAFGMRLREAAARTPVALTEIGQWARAGGEDAQRAEFLSLVQSAGQVLR